MALNKAGVNMRWGLSTLSFFLLMSFLCTLGCGSYKDGIKSIEHTSHRFLKEFALRNSGAGGNCRGKNLGEGDGPTKIAVTSSGRDAPVE
jgi:hypothetical protein